MASYGQSFQQRVQPVQAGLSTRARAGAGPRKSHGSATATSPAPKVSAPPTFGSSLVSGK